MGMAGDHPEAVGALVRLLHTESQAPAEAREAVHARGRAGVNSRPPEAFQAVSDNAARTAASGNPMVREALP